MATRWNRRPTDEAMGGLQAAYDHFNAVLFGGQLPAVLLTLQRKSKRSYGYFSPRRFSDGRERTDELAMNPMHFHTREPIEALSTLAHEMAHVWQAHFGKSGRGKYHNREWGTKMKEIGLYPSNTGAAGGKETGDQMSHYIVAGGAFERCALRFLEGGFRLQWGEPGLEPAGAVVVALPGAEVDRTNRARFSCASCGLKAWAKPTAKLVCGECRTDLRIQ